MIGDSHELRTQAADNTSVAKVRIRLSPDDAINGVEAETVWAIRIESNVFRLDNIPFYANGISLWDLVLAEPQNGISEFVRVIERSGHSTYRVMVNDEAGSDSDIFRNLWKVLQPLGCSFEVAKRRWVAFDVPPTADIQIVYGELKSGEDAGHWWFEEAHCAHITTGH